jgi:hypothetical protein
MLDADSRSQTPLITRRFCGVIEKFRGAGIIATFNSPATSPTTR